MSVGLVRRIDDLGRIVIPREIRNKLRITEGDPIEIDTNKEGEIIMKKWSEPSLETVSNPFIESIADVRNTIVYVTDCDKIIATSSTRHMFKCLVGKTLRDEIINEIKRGFDSFTSEDVSCDSLTEEYDDESSFVVAPIKNNSDIVVGSIIMLTSELDVEPEEWLVQIAAKTIGKQLS